MDALPDLATVSDTELRDLIRGLLKEEQDISYRRRLLHGKIDILPESRGRTILREVRGAAHP